MPAPLHLSCWEAEVKSDICCAQGDFHGVRAEMEKEAMRAAKLDQRLAVLTKGYVSREAALHRGIETAWHALQAAQQVCALLQHTLTALAPLSVTS